MNRLPGRWTGRFLGRRAAVAGGLVVGALVLVPAAPASAASANIVVTGPAPGQSFTSGVTSASVAITGNANISPGTLETNVVTDVQVAVTLGASTVYSCAHAADCGATNGQPGTNFSFTPVVTRNGPYGVSALVTGTECNVLNNCTLRSSTAATSFNVGVRPASPRNVTAQVNSDGSVTVSWAANPEPDLVGYQILRGGPGGSKTVNPFLKATSWTDTGTGTTGGDFGYTVVAFRPGADGSFNSLTALSASSAVANASVPVPPAPTTTLGPVGQPVADTTTTTMAPAPPSGPDLSAFLNQATKAGAIPVAPPKVVVHASAPPPKLVIPSAASSAAPPDTYAPNLPYGAKASSPALAAGGGGPQVPLSGRPVPGHHGRSLLYPVAAGIFLCVLGLALRSANRKSGPAPLEPVGDRGRRHGAAGVPVADADDSAAAAVSLAGARSGGTRPGGTRPGETRSGGTRSVGTRSVGTRPGGWSPGVPPAPESGAPDVAAARSAAEPHRATGRADARAAAGADAAGAVVGAGDPTTVPAPERLRARRPMSPQASYFSLVRSNRPDETEQVEAPAPTA